MSDRQAGVSENKCPVGKCYTNPQGDHVGRGCQCECHCGCGAEKEIATLRARIERLKGQLKIIVEECRDDFCCKSGDYTPLCACGIAKQALAEDAGE